MKTKTPDPIVDAARQRMRLSTRVNAARRKFEALKKELSALDEQILSMMNARKLQSVRVRGMNFTPSSREIAELYDFDALAAYVRRHNAFDLLHRRVSIEAARARWADSVEVPGVRPGTVPYLSITRAGPGSAS